MNMFKPALHTDELKYIRKKNGYPNKTGRPRSHGAFSLFLLYFAICTYILLYIFQSVSCIHFVLVHDSFWMETGDQLPFIFFILFVLPIAANPLKIKMGLPIFQISPMPLR